MTLQEVAQELAVSMNCTIVPGDNPHEVRVKGAGYGFVVSAFFGGWQVTLYLPDKPPATFYAEAVEMLQLRLKAKLAGRDANF